MIQDLLVKEEENKVENIRMRNCYNIVTLTSVAIRRIVKIGGKVIEIYGGAFYR